MDTEPDTSVFESLPSEIGNESSSAEGSMNEEVTFLFYVDFVYRYVPSGGSRIFQRAASTYYLANIFRKLHENEDIIAQRGVSHVPPRSATGAVRIIVITAESHWTCYDTHKSTKTLIWFEWIFTNFCPHWCCLEQFQRIFFHSVSHN